MLNDLKALAVIGFIIFGTIGCIGLFLWVVNDVVEAVSYWIKKPLK